MSPANCDPDIGVYERVATLEARITDMAPKVDAMYEMMIQGRGATRLSKGALALMGAAGVGTLASHKWQAFLAWLGS